MGDKGNARFQGRQTRFLLWLGTALIMLAGIIFVSTTWNTLTDEIKVGMIAGAAIIFAAVSRISKKKLELNNTGEAFYVLAQVFSGITMAALWGYDFLWEGATLETVSFIYLCWLAVWGLIYENRMLNGVFWAVSLCMLAYRWCFWGRAVYPVAVIGAAYMLANYAVRNRGMLSKDWIMAYAAMIGLTLLGMTGKNAGFSFWLIIALRCMDRARRMEGHGRSAGITGAVLALCISFYAQNIIEIGGVMEAELNMFPAAAFAWSLGPIWNRKDGINRADGCQFLIALGCIFTLGANAVSVSDALLAEKLLHTVIMACVCLSMILLSTYFRSSTGSELYIKWQILGVAGLAGLILRVTWSFWASLGWWVYLLIAGVALIVTAAVKEVRDREKEV